MDKYNSKAVGVPIGDITVNVSIQEDNSDAFVLVDTLPNQFIPCRIIMLLRPSYFEKNHNHKIKLVKIDTEEHIGGVITKGLVIVPFEYLKKKLMGC